MKIDEGARSRRPSNRTTRKVAATQCCFDQVDIDKVSGPKTFASTFSHLIQRPFSAADNDELAGQLLRWWHQAVSAKRSGNVKHPRSLLPSNHISRIAYTPRCIQPRYPTVLGAAQSNVYLPATVSHERIRLCTDVVSVPTLLLFRLSCLSVCTLPARGHGQLRCFLYIIYLTPTQ